MVNTDFKCSNCGKNVSSSGHFGSSHRNHCPHCGYSVHVDDFKGDRKSGCLSLMKPVALAFKSNEEICLVHKCLKCGKVNYNRIASDDDTGMIIDIIQNSVNLDADNIKTLESSKVSILDKSDEEKIRIQLFGHPSPTL